MKSNIDNLNKKAKRYYRKIINRSGIPAKFENDTFATYDPNFYPGLDRKVDYIKEYASKFPDLDYPFLLLFGNVGNGKTHLAVAAAKVMINAKAKHLAKKYTWNLPDKNNYLQYINWRKEIKKKRASYGNQGSSSYSLLEAIEKMEQAEILILDDLFARSKISSADIDDVFDMLGHRYENNKPTIITSNKKIPSFLTGLKPKDLLDYSRKPLSQEDVNEITERLASRILENAGDTQITFDGPNYRTEGGE